MKIAKSGTLVSIMMIFLVLSIASLGTFAYFNDVETSEGNVFSAGTLDLKVDGGDNPVTINVANIAPSWSASVTLGTSPYRFALHNVGTLSGKLTVSISAIVNYENAINEPEEDAGDTSEDVGELGEFLMVRIGTDNGWEYWRPLNDWVGIVAPTAETWAGDTLVLAPDGYSTVYLELKLPSDTGNIVQSDSVTFDITFRLDQVV